MKYRKVVQATACLHCNSPLPADRPLRNFCTKSHYTMWLYHNSVQYRHNQQLKNRAIKTKKTPKDYQLHMINKHLFKVIHMMDNERLGMEENEITKEVLTV